MNNFDPYQELGLPRDATAHLSALRVDVDLDEQRVWHVREDQMTALFSALATLLLLLIALLAGGTVICNVMGVRIGRPVLSAYIFAMAGAWLWLLVRVS